MPSYEYKVLDACSNNIQSNFIESLVWSQGKGRKNKSKENLLHDLQRYNKLTYLERVMFQPWNSWMLYVYYVVKIYLYGTQESGSH